MLRRLTSLAWVPTCHDAAFTSGSPLSCIQTKSAEMWVRKHRKRLRRWGTLLWSLSRGRCLGQQITSHELLSSAAGKLLKQVGSPTLVFETHFPSQEVVHLLQPGAANTDELSRNKMCGIRKKCLGGLRWFRVEWIDGELQGRVGW